MFNAAMAWFFSFIGIILLAIVIGLLLALPVMWLWDWLMPSIFHLRQIGWFEAWGMAALCRLLFTTSSNK